MIVGNDVWDHFVVGHQTFLRQPPVNSYYQYSLKVFDYQFELEVFSLATQSLCCSRLLHCWSSSQSSDHREANHLLNSPLPEDHCPFFATYWQSFSHMRCKFELLYLFYPTQPFCNEIQICSLKEWNLCILLMSLVTLPFTFICHQYTIFYIIILLSICIVLFLSCLLFSIHIIF